MAEPSRTMRAVGSIVACLLAVSCAVREPTTADPLSRNLQWFSYVGGDDVRDSCVAAGPSRYRFVYNAVWEEQVRTYDIERLPAGQGAVLTIRVIRGAPRLLQAYLADSSAVGSSRHQVRIPESDYLALIRAAEADGFGAAMADGTRLESYDFYWLANACAAGRWHLHAWRRQDPGFANLRFAEILFRLDISGVTVNPLRRVDPAQRLLQYGESSGERGRALGDSFQLVIRSGRLWGHARL